MQANSLWDELVAVLRMIQQGRALSLELAKAFVQTIRQNLRGEWWPQISEGQQSDGGLAWTLALLRAAELPQLTSKLLQEAVTLLGMFALTMPWVKEATERMAAEERLSKVGACC